MLRIRFTAFELINQKVLLLASEQKLNDYSSLITTKNGIMYCVLILHVKLNSSPQISDTYACIIAYYSLYSLDYMKEMSTITRSHIPT